MSGVRKFGYESLSAQETTAAKLFTRLGLAGLEIKSRVMCDCVTCFQVNQQGVRENSYKVKYHKLDMWVMSIICCSWCLKVTSKYFRL